MAEFFVCMGEWYEEEIRSRRTGEVDMLLTSDGAIGHFSAGQAKTPLFRCITAAK